MNEPVKKCGKRFLDETSGNVSSMRVNSLFHLFSVTLLGLACLPILGQEVTKAELKELRESITALEKRTAAPYHLKKIRLNEEAEFDSLKLPHDTKFSGESEQREVLDGDVIHAKSARKIEVNDEENITVVAAVKNNLSHILVEPGEEYLITFPDDAKWEDGWIDCGPEGWPEKMPDDVPGPVDGLYWAFLNSKPIALLKRVRSARWFELVVTVEYDEDRAEPAGQGQFKQTPWKPTRFGRISFFANDAESKYEKNDGNIDVTVRRIG